MVLLSMNIPLDAGTYKADEAAVERFCELLRIPTVSRENIAERDDEPFNQWIPTLQRLYPHFFKVAELTRVDDFGMLLRWPGADSALDPIVMMAHQDVVPVEGQDWKHDPFGAEIIDGEIWARGSLDTKCIVSAFLEAAEHLIAQGFVPPRDVWFFSSDGEEIAAPTATHAVQWLREHNIHPYMVLDEGGAVVENVFPGVKQPCGLIGIAEKGMLNAQYRTVSAGGLLDDTFDVVVGDIVGFGFLDQVAQARIGHRVRPALSDGDGNLLSDFGEDARALRIGLLLFMHNVFPF